MFPAISIDFPDPQLSDELKTLINKKHAMDSEFIAKRMRDLEEYLKHVMEHDGLAGSKEFLEFIGALEDHSVKADVQSMPVFKLHLDEYLKIVEAGDVILFQTPNIVSKTYRSMVKSTWDHIGMVCYNWTETIHEDHRRFKILEATVDGVHSYSLAQRVRIWIASYPEMKIGVRRLKCRRTFEFERKMNEFVESNIGAKYSLKGYISFKGHSETPLKKGFWFCSELIASCYQYLGLMPACIRPSCYQPYHFALSSEELELVDCTLEDVVELRLSRLQLFCASLIKERKPTVAPTGEFRLRSRHSEIGLVPGIISRKRSTSL